MPCEMVNGTCADRQDHSVLCPLGICKLEDVVIVAACKAAVTRDHDQAGRQVGGGVEINGIPLLAKTGKGTAHRRGICAAALHSGGGALHL